MLIIHTLMLTPGPPGMIRTAENTLDAGCEPTAWARTLSDSNQLFGNLLYLALYSISFSTLAIVLVDIASTCVRCQTENNRISKGEFHVSSFRGNDVCVCGCAFRVHGPSPSSHEVHHTGSLKHGRLFGLLFSNSLLINSVICFKPQRHRHRHRSTGRSTS